MLRRVFIQIYLVLHAIAYRFIRWNPLIPKRIHGRAVQYGLVSDEHLACPQLDVELAASLREIGVRVERYRIDIDGYREYLTKANYPKNYYSGGKKEKANFPEKTLEHYVSAEVLELAHDDVVMDVAARRSPFHEIVQRIWKPEKVYRQDLVFPAGIHGDTIGGSACKLPLPENSLSKVTLHCSLEHFEGDLDMELFREMSRVLRPGGKLCIIPFYIAKDYTIHTDPVHTLLFGRNLVFDPAAQVRYYSWHNRHTRHYDVAAIKRRLLPNLGKLDIKIFQVENFRDVHPSCYLRFIGLFEKKG